MGAQKPQKPQKRTLPYQDEAYGDNEEIRGTLAELAVTLFVFFS